MKGYVGEVLNDYAREGRRLYNDLFIDSRYEWGERGCRDYLDASARYKFMGVIYFTPVSPFLVLLLHVF